VIYMISLLSIPHMDRLIRNIDRDVYRRFKAQAAAEGRSIGEVINDAMRAYLPSPPPSGTRKRRRKSIADLPVWDFGPGSERWSEEIDEFLYGGKP
jgi:antitoxin FitA-like protein